MLIWMALGVRMTPCPPMIKGMIEQRVERRHTQEGHRGDHHTGAKEGSEDQRPILAQTFKGK